MFFKEKQKQFKKKPYEKKKQKKDKKNKNYKDESQPFGHIKQLFIFHLKFISFILEYTVKSNGHLKL